MKIVSIKRIILFALLVTTINWVFGQAADQTTNVQTQQQMLQQISQLQKQQLAQQNLLTAQQQATTPSQSTGRLHSDLVNTAAAVNSVSSGFEYPFKDKQIPKGELDNNIAAQAYSGTVDNLLPMSPEQIHHLRQLYTASQFAAAAPAGVPPRPVVRAQRVLLAPGDVPPVIRLAEGYVTTVVFLDATGAPWPISAYDIYSSSKYDVQWNKKDNVLMIQAKSLFPTGNLVVRLLKFQTPVTITLVAGGPDVDYRVDMHIPEIGPEATALPISSGLPNQADAVLLEFLNGIPPDGSKELTASGGTVRAWIYQKNLYIRTSLTLLSPGWLATMSSADGTHVYVLQTSPDLLVSDNGREVHIKLVGF